MVNTEKEHLLALLARSLNLPKQMIDLRSHTFPSRMSTDANAMHHMPKSAARFCPARPATGGVVAVPRCPHHLISRGTGWCACSGALFLLQCTALPLPAVTTRLPGRLADPVMLSGRRSRPHVALLRSYYTTCLPPARARMAPVCRGGQARRRKLFWADGSSAPKHQIRGGAGTRRPPGDLLPGEDVGVVLLRVTVSLP